MTLKEKIQDVEIGEGMSDRLEKIADDYAIEFAKWLQENNGAMSYQELLEIFKKEKGL
jgi:hypothetical protein